MAETLCCSLRTSHATPWWSQLAATLALWRRRAREREELARFDDRALRDIRLTRAEAARIYRKPFWRA